MVTKASKTIVLCSIANFVNSADRVIMPIAIISIADQYKLDLHNQGWVLSSFAVGYMSSQVSIEMKVYFSAFETFLFIVAWINTDWKWLLLYTGEVAELSGNYFVGFVPVLCILCSNLVSINFIFCPCATDKMKY